MSDGQRTISETSPAPVRLLHLSDIHFGAENVEALRAVELFVARAAPAMVVISGDITQSGRRREFRAAQDWIDALPAPVAATPGNHDTPVYDVFARMFSPFHRYARHLGGVDATGRLIELDGGRIRITGLNTARGVQARGNWAEGVVGLDDLDDAVERLAGGRADAWRLLLCHHPLLAPEGARIGVNTRRGREALRLAAAGGIDAVLTGHIHDAFAAESEAPLSGPIQLGAGTLSTRVRATPASFCLIEIGEHHLAQDVVRFEDRALTLSRAFTVDRRREAALTPRPDRGGTAWGNDR